MASSNKITFSHLRFPLFLWSLPLGFITFMLPIFGKNLNATATQIGSTFSILTITSLVLRPVVGRLVDTFGQKFFFVASFGIYSVSMLFFAYSDNIQLLLIARLLQGVGSAMLFITINKVVIGKSQIDKRGEAKGTISQITTFGSMVGIFLGFFAYSSLPENNIGWKYIFQFYALGMLISMLSSWYLIPKKPFTPTNNSKRNIEKFQFSEIFSYIMVLALITATSESLLTPIYLIFLQDKFSADIITLAWAFLPASLVTIWGGKRLGSLSDQYGRAPAIMLGLIMTGIFSFIFPNVQSLYGIVVLYILITVVWNISEPAEVALVADQTNNNTHGQAYGWYDFFSKLGASIGPIVGGFLYDNVSIDMPFYINAIMLICCGVMITFTIAKSENNNL